MSKDYTPAEARARMLIDQQLEQAGWSVQNRTAIDLVNHAGVAVREAIMAPGSGRADYLLYVDRRPVGVIEAKPEGTTLTEVEWQSRRYSQGLPEAAKATAELVDGEFREGLVGLQQLGESHTGPLAANCKPGMLTDPQILYRSDHTLGLVSRTAALEKIVG